MFSNLTEKLNSALHVLKGHGKITEINIAETLKEVRRALLDADVSFKIAKDFTNNVKQKALGQRTFRSILIEGKEFEFSSGFDKLHTKVYENILNGKGFSIEDARKSIEVAYQIRNVNLSKIEGDYHPMVRHPLSKHPFL